MRSSAILIAAILAVPVLLTAACGGEDTPSVTTGADGVATATLKTKAGDEWTVTLAEGETEVLDLYGNYGDEPIGIWSPGGGGIAQASGTAFAIGLEQNASTGYVWRAAGGTADGTVVELVEQGVNPHDPGTPGAPGTHYFVYRATTAGQGTLAFELIPPGGDTPETTETFDVTVTD
jgi:predicted secreted protein